MPTAIHEVLCRCCRNLVHHYTVSGEPARARLFASFIADFETTHTRESE